MKVIDVFLFAFAIFRSGKMKVPEWTDFIKTGKFKEMSPYDPDWYFIRAGKQTGLYFTI